ncbi:MAG TPA: 2-oxo acid dehydrogenase subunit E2 [Vicinamibacterales bacterium]|nr:2-oxo acid dehydrogenase subunit E2 [Vicinamibacterales bacterium]
MSDFVLPELGENVEKGDITRVLVNVGDVIANDQPVVELETDKATVEVPSTVSGKVTAIKVKPGDKVKVGQALFSFEAGAAAAAPAPAAAAVDKAPAASPAKETEQTPASTSTPSDLATAAVDKKSADVVDISTGRATPAARPESAPPATSGTPAASASTPAAALAVAPSPAGAIPAAPSVRRFARELGVDIADVAGSGPGGRIGAEDVKVHVKSIVVSPRGGAGGRTAHAPLPDFSKWGAVDVKPMSNIRRKTAEHLAVAWQAPHVTQFDKADITALEAFRKSHGPRVEKAGGKLTVTAILIKICAAAIQRFPQFASSVDTANESIVYKKYVHIGIAVDTPNGLLVPVIRDADKKTITEIAVELGQISQKARDKKLSLEEMSGGVFSISNLGGIGGTAFTPIVNQPEVAILGVSRGAIEPVWNPSTALGAGPSTALGAGGQFVPREMLPLSLSYDHRVIDGADAARFIRFVAEALETPLSMYI